MTSCYFMDVVITKASHNLQFHKWTHYIMIKLKAIQEMYIDNFMLWFLTLSHILSAGTQAKVNETGYVIEGVQTAISYQLAIYTSTVDLWFTWYDSY